MCRVRFTEPPRQIYPSTFAYSLARLLLPRAIRKASGRVEETTEVLDPGTRIMKDRALTFAHPASRVPCRHPGNSFSSLLLDFTLVRLLGALGGPLRRVVALYVVLGKSLWTLVSQLVFKFADGLGWLSAPPRNPVLRSVGRGIISIRRWHYWLGKCPDQSTSLTHAFREYYPSCYQHSSDSEVVLAQLGSCCIQPSGDRSRPSGRRTMPPSRRQGA